MDPLLCNHERFAGAICDFCECHLAHKSDMRPRRGIVLDCVISALNHSPNLNRLTHQTAKSAGTVSRTIHTPPEKIFLLGPELREAVAFVVRKKLVELSVAD